MVIVSLNGYPLQEKLSLMMEAGMYTHVHIPLFWNFVSCSSYELLLNAIEHFVLAELLLIMLKITMDTRLLL